jgi:putative flavoprotein involved in K+ transport
MDLRGEGVETVIWATGCRRAYPWLHVPVLDAHGEIRHTGGITPEAGLYVLGLNFQQRRNSSFIDGVGHDAWLIAHDIARSLTRVRVA